MLIFIFAAHMARARLRDRHQENLLKKLQVLKAEQGVAEEEGADQMPSTSAATIAKQDTNSEAEGSDNDEVEEEEEDENAE